MDQTVIQEIANQLGIAVDNVGVFINEQLPQYAAFKSMQLTALVIGVVVGFIACVIVFTVMWFMGKRKVKLEVEDDFLHGREMKVSTLSEESYLFVIIWILFGLAALVLLITAIIMCTILIPQIVGWVDYPQAMLIDMAISKIS